MTRAVYIIVIAVAVIIGIVLAVMYPPYWPTCLPGEISVQEKANGPWYCVIARRLD